MPLIGSKGPLRGSTLGKGLNFASKALPYAGLFGLGRATGALTPNEGPQYLTEEGVSIPTLTEFAHKQGSVKTSAIPAAVSIPLGSAALTAALAHDYESRLGSGEVGGTGSAAKIRDALTRRAYENPMLTFAGGVGAGAFAKNLASKSPIKLGEWLGDLTIEEEDGEFTLRKTVLLSLMERRPSGISINSSTGIYPLTVPRHLMVSYWSIWKVFLKQAPVSV